jgi:hypothetical protein
MAKIKLTKTAVESAQPQAQAVELRDTVVPGFLCKITPAGRRVFMLQYRTNAGERRKPALGLYGELTVEQARVMAQDWLAEVRRGGDPAAPRPRRARRPRGRVVQEVHGGLLQEAQQAQHAGRLSGRHRPLHHPAAGPQEGAGREAARHCRADGKAGLQADRGEQGFGVLRKMFNLAEVWGYRPDGTNPCRHVPMYPPGKETRLIVDEEMVRIFRQSGEAGGGRAGELRHPAGDPPAIRVRRPPLRNLPLEWSWLDFENRRVVWPDSKTGGMSKPMSEEAYRLLSTAPRREGCPMSCRRPTTRPST